MRLIAQLMGSASVSIFPWPECRHIQGMHVQILSRSQCYQHKNNSEQKGKTEASYIDEGLPAEHADKFSTKETITTMVKNCEHGRLKTILETGNFTMNEIHTMHY